MAKNILLITFIILFLYLIYYFFLSPTKIGTLPIVSLKIKNIDYNLELAKSIKEKSTGLSNRATLCPNCGMIFVYNNQGTLPFWMKDTLIPLDMIWLNQDGKVVDIVTATPQPNIPLTALSVYQNSLPAQYVIELNANDSEKIGLKVGDTINLSPIFKIN